MQKDNLKSKLSLVFSMFIFGTIGIFRKYIPLPSSVLAMARGFIGALFLIFVLLIKREKISLPDVKKNIIPLLLSGVFLGFNWILLFEAYRYTSVATATLCYYMAPIFVIIVSPFLFKEKLTLKKILCVITAFVGIIFVSGVFESAFAGLTDLKGIFLGLGAAVLYASVVIINKKISNLTSFERTIIQLMTAGVVLLPYTLLTENFSEISFRLLSVIMLLVVGIVHTGLAYALYFSTIEKLSAQTVALFSYIDPVVAIILSAVVLKEAISMWAIIGAVLVLGSAFINEFSFVKLKVGKK